MGHAKGILMSAVVAYLTICVTTRVAVLKSLAGM